MNEKLAHASERYIDWMRQDVLPLWSQSGIDSRNGSCFEKLLPNGTPDLKSDRRIRVQARLMFVFSRAEQMGWITGLEDVVQRIGEFVSRHGTLPCRSDGYVHLLDSELRIKDERLDLYDHAFFILSSSAAYATYQKGAELRRAHNIVEWLDLKFKHPRGGWYEGNYKAPCRRQNPHMHLLEAFLFSYEVSGKAVWFKRASEIFELFRRYFYSAQDHVINEFFNDDWSVVEGDQGHLVEPGHMLEWVWLLDWYRRCAAKQASQSAEDIAVERHTDIVAMAEKLYYKALSIGRDKRSRLFYDAVDRAGTPLQSTKRLWPLTEYIKASLTMATFGYAEGEQNAADGIELLFEYYIDAAESVRGTFIDRRGPDNKVFDNMISASTLYHLMSAATELSAYSRKSG